jgi:tripartite-type tricarboxylate transporter receptor subunit TctC
MKRSALKAALAAVLILSAGTLRAETVEEFYRGKTLQLMVGGGSGGGNDFFARIFAKHFPRLMPGSPNIVIFNIPGAGGIVGANQLYNTMPRDGTVMGMFQRNIPLEPLLSDGHTQYDSLKMQWIGSLNSETNVVVAWHTARVKKFEDLFTTEFLIGASGGAADSLVYPLLFNRVLGTKFKIVRGYKSGDDLDLAMERGEVEGRASVTWTTFSGSRGQAYRAGKAFPLAQFGLTKNPALPNLPNLYDLVKDPTDRQVFELLLARQETGRPCVVAPDVPADRVAALRKAFEEVAADKEFLADIKARGGTIELITGKEVEDLLRRLYAAPKDIVERTKAVLAGQ